MADEGLIEAMARVIDPAAWQNGRENDPFGPWFVRNAGSLSVARAALTALREAGYAVVPADDWRPIETLDRKPRKDGAPVRVLVWCDMNGRCVVEINPDGSLSPVPASRVKLIPTYWQPIAERPRPIRTAMLSAAEQEG